MDFKSSNNLLLGPPDCPNVQAQEWIHPDGRGVWLPLWLLPIVSRVARGDDGDNSRDCVNAIFFDKPSGDLIFYRRIQPGDRDRWPALGDVEEIWIGQELNLD